MKKKFISIILIFVMATLCGCSAERIAKAIDEDLGTNTQTIGSNIDSKTEEITEKYDKGLEEKDTSELAKDVTEFFIDKTAEIAKKVAEDDPKSNTPSARQDGLEKMQLVSVTDGDTIIALGEDGFEYRIRLIGIDTPESVNSDESKNNKYGDMASIYTKELLRDVSDIYIETDEELYDKYNRLLAYVWLRDDSSDINNMVNAIIAKNGYCRQMSIKPNTKYSSELGSLVESAKRNHIGLWEYDEYIKIAEEED